MKYEDEADVLEDICLVTQSEIEEEILNSLRQYKKFYINNSGHECLPPDFISINGSFMFDVM